MANSFSNRKVARAARMGGGRKRKPSAALGWYASLAAIVLVGSVFVGFSRAEYRDESTPGSTPPLSPTDDRGGDQWIEAIGFYTCDKFAPNLPAPESSDANPTGLTTNGDGLVLVAPSEKKYSGRNATFGLFAENNGVELERESFRLPGDETVYGPGFRCGDKDAKLVIREWEDASDPTNGDNVVGSPESILLKESAALTIAWVPSDFDEDTLPIPPSAAGVEARVAQLQAEAGDAGGAAGVPTDPTAGATPLPSEPPATPAPQ